MSNFSGDEGSFSSGNAGEEVGQHDEKRQQPLNRLLGPSNLQQQTPGTTNDSSSSTQPQQPVKKKRNLPGTPVRTSFSGM